MALRVVDLSSPTEIIGADAIERLQRLALRGRAQGTQPGVDVDWNRPLSPPRWLPRRQWAALVADFRSGELATAQACDHLVARLPDAGLGECLEVQREDEHRHAALYQRYLEMLGVPAVPNPALVDVFERCLSWPGHPVAVLVAFNVMLEAEALRLQRYFARHSACPLFAEINRRVLKDEARHVSSGRVYAEAVLALLDLDQRATIHAWLRSLWWEGAALVRERFPWAPRRSIDASLAVVWQAQSRALIRLGLPALDHHP